MAQTWDCSRFQGGENMNGNTELAPWGLERIGGGVKILLLTGGFLKVSFLQLIKEDD